jgi:hypothetical protein
MTTTIHALREEIYEVYKKRVTKNISFRSVKILPIETNNHAYDWGMRVYARG